MDSSETFPRHRARSQFGLLGVFAAGCTAFLVLSAAVAGACPPGSNSNGASSDGQSRPVFTDAALSSGTLVGTIASVGTTSFNLLAHNGTTWTVTVTPSTEIAVSGRSISYSQLVSGEKVRVLGTVSSGTDVFAATKVSVSLVHLEGPVMSTASGSFVISDDDGFWRIIVESASTTYSIGPSKLAQHASAASIVPGMVVDVLGTVDANHTSLDAVVVRIELSRIEGTVTSVAGTSLLISHDGTSTSLITSPSTIFSDSSGVISLGAIVVGASVLAYGSPAGSGSFDAAFVVVTSKTHFEPPSVQTIQREGDQHSSDGGHHHHRGHSMD